METIILEALKKLTTDALVRGMRAFDHPPRFSYRTVPGDSCGCFVSACFETDAHDYRGLPWTTADNAIGMLYRMALSGAYEVKTDWFRAECIRELAERGVYPEAAAVRPVEVVETR